MTPEEQEHALTNSNAGKTVKVAGQPAKPNSAGQSIPHEESTATKPIEDIREWNESIDGVSAERLRNCILFQLDYTENLKSKQFYRSSLTPAYLRRVRKDIGMSGAKHLDESTPIGWTPPEQDPMIVLRTQSFDGEVNEVPEIVRWPKNQAERDVLLSRLTSRRGRVNPNISKWLVDRKCPQCKGVGNYLVESHPDDKNMKWQETWRDCACITAKEFKAQSY